MKNDIRSLLFLYFRQKKRFAMIHMTKKMEGVEAWKDF